MSIKVRRAIQPLLDEAGLEFFHAGLQGSTNLIQIRGQCGKPYVTISGIKFSQSNPGKEDVAYAAELFKDFLEQNGEELARLPKLLAKKKTEQERWRAAQKLLLSCHGVGGVREWAEGSYGEPGLYVRTRPGFWLKVDMRTGVTTLHEYDAKDLSLTEEQISAEFAILDRLETERNGARKARKSVLQVEQELDDLVAKLQTCDI